MNSRNLTLILLLAFMCNGLYAQRKPKVDEKPGSIWHKDKTHFEFGLNVSQTLIQFLSSGGGLEPQDPFQIGVKWGNKIMLRVGGAAKYITKEEEFLFQNETFLTKEVNYLGRIGLEHRYIIGPRFTLNLGADLFYQHFNSSSTFVSNVFSTIKLEEFRESRGGGPIFGFMYHINHRLSLGTEMFIYWSETEGYREEPKPGTLEVYRINTKESGFRTALPNSLYFIFKF